MKLPHMFRVALATMVAVVVLSACLDGRVTDPMPTALPTPSSTLIGSVSPTHSSAALEPIEEQGSGFGSGPKLGEIAWRYNPPVVQNIGSVVAHDGTLYLDYSGGPHGSEIHVVDAKTGELEWRIEGASSPVVADGRIYYSRGCGLYAADLLTHQEVWRYETSCVRIYPRVVKEGIVYSDAFHGDEKISVSAVDANSNQQLWRFDVRRFALNLAHSDDNVYFSTYVATTYDAKHILSVHGLFALDSKSGAERWKFVPPGDEGIERRILDMAVSHGMVYITIISYTPSGVEYLYALDGKTGDVRWKFRPREYAHELRYVTAADDLVYLTTDGGYLHALDTQTGAEEWSFQAGNHLLAPTLVGDMLYLAVNKRPGPGHIYALESKTGKELGSLLLGSEITSAPVVLGDMLYVTQSHSGEYLTAVR